MSVQSIYSTSSTSYSSDTSALKNRQDPLSMLSKALDSGDLSSAKSILAKMQSFASKNGLEGASSTDSSSSSSSTSDSTSTTGTDQRSQDMAALSKALDSGDLTAAKSALATIKSHMKEHGAPPSDSTNSTSSTSATSELEAALLKALTGTTDNSGSSTTTGYTSSGSSTTSSNLFNYGTINYTI